MTLALMLLLGNLSRLDRHLILLNAAKGICGLFKQGASRRETMAGLDSEASDGFFVMSM
jgi:hypothetical protein